jgi:tetratricopeptide (TPR) repeat protein
MTDNNKPNLVNYGENEWEFVYPPNIDNESVYNEFWEGVEQLDYNDKIAEKIFKLLIKKHPFYLDAYNHLSIAFRNQNKTFESFITAEKAYNLGKSIFPKEFNKDKDELIWSNHDNRPFLRCCQTFGQEYQLQNKYKKAIEIYSEILHYNNGDNQGIRYLILECLFALKDYKQAEIFISKLYVFKLI